MPEMNPRERAQSAPTKPAEFNTKGSRYHKVQAKDAGPGQDLEKPKKAEEPNRYQSVRPRSQTEPSAPQGLTNAAPAQTRARAQVEPPAPQGLTNAAPAAKHYGAWEPFADKTPEGTGGATGSGRVKVGDQNYQVKGSIEHAPLKRRLKAGGLNHENYGEVISSNVARAMMSPANRELIPEVSLRQNANSHEAMVTSRYLTDGKGDLDALYCQSLGADNKPLGSLPKGQKHVYIQLDSAEPSGGGVLRLDGSAAQDLKRNIALSALLGDHDVNLGNMIAVEGNRVGRIDFGHAFNELITAPGGARFGGGGVRETNRILDFFNRETVSGMTPSQQKSKLWRDYSGAGPSEGMTQALREMASNGDSLDGLAQAKAQFLDLAVDLENENTPEARKQLQNLTQSLAKISANIGKPVTQTDPGGTVKEVFQNLDTFVREGQAQMEQVADLSSLQTQIDSFVKNPVNRDKEMPAEIRDLYSKLVQPDSTLKTANGDGLHWMKIDKKTPAFQGNLEAYVAARRTACGFPDPLPKLSEGSRWDRLRGRGAAANRVNQKVEALNQLRLSGSKVDLKEAYLEIGKAIQRETQADKAFGTRPEVEKLRQLIRKDVLALSQNDTAPAVVGKAPGIFGAPREVDVSPSKWMEPLGEQALDLTGLVGQGDGKKGAQGTTFGFTTADGRHELIGKTDRSNVIGEVRREFENYKQIYEKAGKHKNLGNVHGWADLRLGNLHAEGMLMDKVPGPDGRKFQADLKAAWDDGVISTEQYWGAVQHVTRVQLEVADHLHKAGFAHNDIKPENYVIDATTGEPIVIDLGGAAQVGEQPGAITEEYAPPEMLKEDGRASLSAKGTGATDVFTVGSTLQNTVESPSVFHKVLRPNTPMSQVKQAFNRDARGEAMKTPYQASANTAYTKFVKQTMAPDATERPTAADAIRPTAPTEVDPAAADAFGKNFPGKEFLEDSLLDPERARAVLKGVASGELRKAWEKRWTDAGKPIPKSIRRYSKPEIESALVAKSKEIDNFISNRRLQSSEERDQLRGMMKELDEWIERGRPMGVETKRMENLNNRIRRRLEQAAQNSDATK